MIYTLLSSNIRMSSKRKISMKKLPLFLTTAAAIFSVVGCASMNSGINRNVKIETYSPVEIISQESQKALHAQQILTKYKQAQNQTLEYRQKSFENDKIIVDFIGKPRDVISSIAIKYGYRFIEVGNPRDLPIVNFTQVYSTPQDLLVNLNAQLGKQAELSINKNEKIITLVY